MTLQDIYEDIARLTREKYPERVPVFGDGDPNAEVVLIGEAPGEQETKQGRPFVGKAGKNLDEFLALAGMDRSALYVTNTVKFRPTKRSKAGNEVNRPPTKEEIRDYLPFLLRELELIRPKYTVTLGNTPLQALAGKGVTVGEAHGALTEARGFCIYPMYHPASLIYNPSLRPVYKADIVRFAQLLKT